MITALLTWCGHGQSQPPEAPIFRPAPSLTARPGGHGTIGLTATVRDLRSTQIGKCIIEENMASIRHPSPLFENSQAAWAVPFYRHPKQKAICN